MVFSALYSWKKPTLVERQSFRSDYVEFDKQCIDDDDRSDDTTFREVLNTEAQSKSSDENDDEGVG